MNIHAEITKQMQAMAKQMSQSGVTLVMPPPSNETLGTVYVGIEQGVSLTAEIPYNRKFANPLLTFQGGFLAAAFDDVFGPLTYMVAGGPAVTVEMSTTFIRPFTDANTKIVIRAEVVARTKRLIILKAEARSIDGSLISTSSSHAMILESPAQKS